MRRFRLTHYLVFSFVFSVFTLINVNLKAQDCTETLTQARNLFNEGVIESIPQMLEACIENGFNKEEKVQAYKLLIQAYLFEDNIVEAENTLLKLKKTNPVYEIDCEKEVFEFIRMLAISKTMSVKSQYIETDNNLKGLLAYQSYKYNEEYGGNKHDPDIYNSLYLALKVLNEKNYNIYNGHTQPVRASVFDKTNKRLISTGSDGRILAWDNLTDTTKYSVIHENSLINRALAISDDGKWLACGTQNSIIQLIQLEAAKGEPIDIIDTKQIIWGMKFSPDNKYLYTIGSDTTISRIDLSNINNEVVAHCGSNIKCLAISNDGKTLAAGTDDGTIEFWKVDQNFSRETIKVDSNAIFAIELRKDGALLATGDQKGIVKIWDANSKNKIMTLTGHQARVNDSKVDPGGNLIASASSDGSVRIWETAKLNENPIILTDQATWIMAISFNEKGDKIYTGSKNNLIQIWETATEPMTQGLCSKLTRNMSLDEWGNYVGKDINYEKTCVDLP